MLTIGDIYTKDGKQETYLGGKYTYTELRIKGDPTGFDSLLDIFNVQTEKQETIRISNEDGEKIKNLLSN